MTRTEAIEREVNDVVVPAPVRAYRPVRLRHLLLATGLLTAASAPWAVGLMTFAKPLLAAWIAFLACNLLVWTSVAVAGVLSWVRPALSRAMARRAEHTTEQAPRGVRLAMD
ncbi:MAG: hypothetical protein AAF288_02970 [Planctomycetota bacterium]